MNDTTRIVCILRSDYLRDQVLKGKILEEEQKSPAILSFQANSDPKSKLFFWQLYSILGNQQLKNIITIFYTSIFNDNAEPWFRDVFVEFGPIEYHVRGQYLFWADAFAGKSIYKKGLSGLYFHHKLAKEIMTAKGAERWMMHMRIAIEKVRPTWDNIDKRAIPCLYEFLSFNMEKYGVQFDFTIVEWIHSLVARL